MVVSLKHKFVPALADSGDAGEVSTNAWTDEHDLVVPAGEFLVGTGTGVEGQTAATARGTMGAEALGTAAAAIIAHEAAANPHPEYLTPAEGDAAYSAIGHTHTASSVSDFSEAVDDRVAALLVAGANVTLTYNDGAGTLTVAASGGGGGGNTNSVVLKSDLAALSAGAYQGVIVTGRTALGDGGGGVFAWRSGNQSAKVTADPQAGIVVPPASDTSGASGVWERVYTGYVFPEWFGAKGDGTTDDTTAVAAAINWAGANASGVSLDARASYLLTTWATIDTSNIINIQGNGATLKGPVTQVNFLTLGTRFDIRDCIFERWRCVIQRLLAASGSFDGAVFKGNTVTNFNYIAIDIERPFTNGVIDSNIITAGTAVAYGLRIGVDTQTTGGFALQVGWNNYQITNNVIKTITATSGNNGCGIMAHGTKAKIVGNLIDTIQTVDPAKECWGIYTKLTNSTVTNNIIANLSCTDTSNDNVIGINIKGTNRGTGSAAETLESYDNVVSGNVIRTVGVQGVRGVGIQLEGEEHNCTGNNLTDTGRAGLSIKDSLGSNKANLVFANKIIWTASGGVVGVDIYHGVAAGLSEKLTIASNIIGNCQNGIAYNPLGSIRDVLIYANTMNVSATGITVKVPTGKTGDRIKLQNNVISATTGFDLSGAGSFAALTISDNDINSTTTKISGTVASAWRITGNVGYKTQNSNYASSVASGGTISHGLGIQPTYVSVCPNSSSITNIQLSSVNATTFTVSYTGTSPAAFFWEARAINADA